MQETLDEGQFDKKIINAIHLMQEDDDTKEFANYFCSTYLSNKIKWAYCFRKGSGINTNMYLESFHKILKYIYLEGKKTKRLDKGIHALIKLVRDKTVERLIKLTKGKNTKHMSDIRKRHRTALAADFTVVEKDTFWTLTSNGTEYFITKNIDHQLFCHLKCSYCNICIQCFTCSCLDFLNKCTICKHIHYIVLKCKFNRGEETTVRDNINITASAQLPEEICDHLQTLNSGNQGSGNKNLDVTDQLKFKIFAKLKSIQGCVDACSSPEILSQVYKYLENSETLLQSNSDNIRQFEQKEDFQTPSNTNITKQIRFFSTQKKRAKSGQKKPQIAETEVIEKFLNNEKVEYTTSDPYHDHQY